MGNLDHAIQEVWLFDASYGQLEEIAQYFVGNRLGSRRLRSIFTEHLRPQNLDLMTLLSLEGTRFAVLSEDRLTTRGTTKAEFTEMLMRSKYARPETDEMTALLKHEPIMFIVTGLAHNEVVAKTQYFRRFAQTSPHLDPISNGEAREKE